MKSNTVLYEETISSIRGQDIDVILNMGNSISWTINGSNIVADEANGIDMGITPESKNIPDALMAQASALSTAGMVIGLSLAHSGPLDFHPILTISTAPENAGLTANLYYYNPDSEQLEFTDAVVIDADGSIRFTFSHASDYVIIISETVMTNTSIIPSESSAGSTPAQEPSSEDTDADRQEDPLTEEESSGLKLTTIFLIAAMLLIAVAIGLTAFSFSAPERARKKSGKKRMKRMKRMRTMKRFGKKWKAPLWMTAIPMTTGSQKNARR